MRKRHRKSDYVVVSMMVSGLAFFIHAETTAKDDQHTFSFVGIGMLVLALLADGAVVNLNEKLMNVHGLGQDEMIFMLYSLATSIMFIMTLISGQLWKGLNFLLVDGPMMEASISYTSKEKLLGTLAFVMMGFLGSSCAGAITKHFGALSMSITSTARKVGGCCHSSTGCVGGEKTYLSHISPLTLFFVPSRPPLCSFPSFSFLKCARSSTSWVWLYSSWL